MFSFNNPPTLISLGNLERVLEGKGTLAIPLKFSELVDKRYVVDMEITILQQPILKEHIGFLIPMLGYLNQETELMPALSKSSWKLKKILLAVSEYTTEIQSEKYHEIGSTQPMYSPYPQRSILRGCAQLVPLSDEEKFLCGVRSIAFEE